MESLYNISDSILRIFNEVELNEGEITEEQIELLNIKQEELSNKLQQYYNAVKHWDNDIAEAKAEQKRIKGIIDVKQKRIDRLKSAMLTAVETFGQTSKSNKFIELPYARLYTRASTSVDINEERLRIFIDKFEKTVRELVDNGILYTGDDVDLYGLLDTINAECIAEYGDSFQLFTISDLNYIDIEIKTKMSISELFSKGKEVLESYGKNPIHSTIVGDINKSDIKRELVEIKQDLNNPRFTVAKLTNKNNLNFK